MRMVRLSPGLSGAPQSARAFRWKWMLDSDEFATIAELAEREGIALSYMIRVLRLTLLAPDIIEAILDGKQGPEVTLARSLEAFPTEWSRQETLFTNARRYRRCVFNPSEHRQKRNACRILVSMPLNQPR